MNKTEAITLVQAAFDADYSAQSFERFVSNLFKGEYMPLDKRRDGHYVREAFRSFVQGYRILGTYQDAEGSILDILEVTLQRESSLDRARTAQRNFVADYLKKNGKDAALIAFLSPDQHDWRFSLVKLEYSLAVKNGRVKTEEELTPAKRWSFLIGRNEGSHTVQSRFVSLLQDSQKPLLKELEEAFNIESVTDEFFKKYCELFFRMKESLDKLLASDPAIKADFEAKELTTVDFAKKTLGQMAFLYFLQKKGWFGVAPDKPWGTGPKDFLRQLFNRREKYGKNFFDDVLEPLFYEALAQDRGVKAIYPRLNNCRMPFLNGGLFEPMNGYAWETTNIRLPDELFSNSNRTPEGDEGDGILDVFDRYNFTVNENEPLEKEVAVDPEMLGKVFENLLEVKDRKSKGTFYTPREIVHFMCQESLISFLNTELKGTLPREDIEALIRNGSQIIQNDAMVLEKGTEGTYKFMLPESIRARAAELDRALADIKVCDPAVGSGAFPLGMLNEIVQARQALAVHLRSDQSAFGLKLHCISHSLYGVDIDPGAVEIAKLRLWLALVVEENEPHPLPNLEHKVMQGNSLISEYEGVRLFDESFLEEANKLEKELDNVDGRLSELQRDYFALHSQEALNPVKKEEIEREIRLLSKRKKALSAPNGLHGQELSMFDVPGKLQKEKEKAERLQKKIDQYISESARGKKQQLKDQIEQLKWELIEASLRKQRKLDRIDDLNALRHKNIKPFFIWKLEFSDVFSNQGGFDVVIANPPYVGESGNKEIFQEIAQGNLSQFYLGKMDLFYFFFHLALNIGRSNSSHAFISTNYFFTAFGAKKLRYDLKERASIAEIINFNELRVFPTARGQHNAITIFKKGQLSGPTRTTEVFASGNALSGQIQEVLQGSFAHAKSCQIERKHLFEGPENYIRLQSGGVGEMTVHSVLEKVKSAAKRLGEVCEIKQGVVSGCDTVTAKVLEKLSDREGVEVKDGIYVFDLANPRDVAKIERFSQVERTLLRPFFKNSDIHRYVAKSKETKKLLYLGKKTRSLDGLPQIAEHLDRFRELLDARREVQLGRIQFFHLQWPRTEATFLGKKIVAPYRSRTNTFAITTDEWFCRSDCYVIKPKTDSMDLEFIVGVLNSKLVFHWLYNKGKRKGEVLELFQVPLSEIPFPHCPESLRTDIASLVKEIIQEAKAENTGSKARIGERQIQIDQLVYDAYGLTMEERQILIDG
jgi:type I restriction-modification system DNA methylase subunit